MNRDWVAVAAGIIVYTLVGIGLAAVVMGSVFLLAVMWP